MKNLEYQVEKEARPETNPRSIVLEEDHNLLNVFSKKNSNTLLFHQKYDHKILIKEQQKYSYTPLYKISPQKLDIVKCYLDSHFAKGISKQVQLFTRLRFSLSKSKVEEFDFVSTIEN